MTGQIHQANIIKSKIKNLQIPFFWQLMIAFALVILVAGGGVSLAGHVALNSLEESFTRDGVAAVTTRLWTDRLAGYYDQNSSWEEIDAMIADYPCGPGWEPWDEDWQTDYLVASANGVVVGATEKEWLGRTLDHRDLNDAAPIMVNDRLVGFLFLSLDRLGRPSMDVIGASLQGFLVAVLIIGGFSLLIGLLLSRGISRPLVELTAVTRAMSAGDLSTRVPVRRHGEARELAVAFNRMAGQVEETIITLRHFVSDAAHELHTPLTALRTNLELAAEAGPGEEGRFVAQAQEQVARLEALTKGLLDLSRLEAGNTSVPREPLELAALVRRVSEVYASRAQQADITFALDLPETPITVSGNADQLSRAIGNLLDNALKFTPARGSVTLRLRALADASAEASGLGLRQDGREVELCVQDSGIGIPEEDLPHLFERFHRGRNAAAYPGSGLGLPIAKAIVESHGGRVRGENVEQGACFTVWLPVDLIERLVA